MGETYLSGNHFDAARERFEDAMRLAPDNPLIWFRLAQALQGMQRLDPARLYYKKYLEAQPKGKFAGNAKKAISLMKAHGCTGGPATPGAGGVWTCNGTKASFKFKWKSGNQLRQLSFEAMQAQLKEVGIQLIADDTPNALTQDLPGGNFDIILFAWIGSPDISGNDAIYGCRSGSTL